MKYKLSEQLVKISKSLFIDSLTSKVTDSHNKEYYEDFILLKKPNKNCNDFKYELEEEPIIIVTDDNPEYITMIIKVEEGIDSVYSPVLRSYSDTLSQLKCGGFLDEQFNDDDFEYCHNKCLERFEPVFLKVINNYLYVGINYKYYECEIKDYSGFNHMYQRMTDNLNTIVNTITECLDRRDTKLLNQMTNKYNTEAGNQYYEEVGAPDDPYYETGYDASDFGFGSDEGEEFASALEDYYDSLDK